MAGAMPNLIIIGAAKAGTTSLHYYLDQHPEVQMSPNKEPNFFSGPENGLPYPMGRVATLDAYEELFDPRFRVRGEASVSYANAPRREGVPERIKKAVPDARIIYMVRDPIDRLLSHYKHRVSWMGERRSLEEAFENLGDPSDVCLCPGFYGRQLGLYLEHFDQEQIKVIDQADLLGRRDEVLEAVFAFLEVDPTFRSKEFEAELLKSTERRVYSPAYVRIVEPLKAAGPLKLIPRRWRKGLRRSVEGVIWPKLESSALGDDLRGRLQELYADDTARLRELTGQQFPSWSL
jgi:hypothetical protein